MIDLHLHLLPAVDDGAATPDVTEAMVARAAALGFRRLIATPHLNGPLTSDYTELVARASADARQATAASGIEFDQGFEIQLSPDLATRLERGEPITLGRSNAVLVEIPFVGWPLFTERALFDLQAAGFHPIFAHPERYAAVQADLDRVLALVERGVHLQVTFGSVTGLFGRRAQVVAEELLQRNAVAVLATDAHGVGQRLETVVESIDRARRLVGPERLRQLVAANPEALLTDRPLPTAIAVEPEPEVGLRSAMRRLGRRFGG